MNAVFFNEELHARAPTSVGTILADDGRWIGLAEVADAMRAGEVVTIRPASACELRRAEAIVEVVEIGAKLAGHLQILYQNKGQDAVDDAICNLHQAVTAVNFAEIALVDEE